MKIVYSIALIACALVVFSCNQGGGEPRIKDAEEVTIYEPTKGTVTEVKEIQPGNEYQIIDERLIDKKEDSYAIVHNLDGTTDSLSLRTIEKDHTSGQYQHSGLRALLFYSLASSFFNNRMSGVQPDRSRYASNDAFQKSQGLKNDMQSSAKSRRIQSPKAGSRGYGSNRSFRSYGG